MSRPIPGDYDPWMEVTILWKRRTTTQTLIRRSEIAGWLGTLPLEGIALFTFKAPDDTERDAPPE
jgi:hypothetical protein